jgi:hypothetical protein
MAGLSGRIFLLQGLLHKTSMLMQCSESGIVKIHLVKYSPYKQRIKMKL